MKLKVGIFFLFFCFVFSYSQRHEIGIFGGIPSLIGDVRNTNFIKSFFSSFDIYKLPNTLGLNYKYNLNSRQSIRLNLFYNKIVFDKIFPLHDYNYNRIEVDKNSLMESMFIFEYYFWDINDEYNLKTSPYIFQGLGILNYKTREYFYNYQFFTSNNLIIKNHIKTTVDFQEINKTIFTLNFGFGIKIKFNDNWSFVLDVGFYPTFVDNLDYSSIKENKINKKIIDSKLLFDPYSNFFNQKLKNDLWKRQFGNSFTNDWYIVTGFGISYAFGRPPCYCD